MVHKGRRETEVGEPERDSEKDWTPTLLALKSEEGDCELRMFRALGRWKKARKMGSLPKVCRRDSSPAILF